MWVMVSSGLVVEPREQVLVERDAFVLAAVHSVVVLGTQGESQLDGGGEEAAGLADGS